MTAAMLLLLCLGSGNRRPPKVARPWLCSVQGLGFRSALRSARLFVLALRKINSSFISVGLFISSGYGGWMQLVLMA